jgi:glycosyltransferase involved in cell wall biosynthesis
MPYISVCIATYNGEKYIKEQLDSILIQIGLNDEVIISDDCSTDKTLDIIKLINDKRIVLLESKTKFKNHNFNFENALKKATGDIIFMADQDDIWKLNKVERVLEIFNNENVNLVISDCILVDANKKTISNSYFNIRNSGKGLLKNFYKNSYVGCCMAFNKKVLNSSLPFPKNTFSHDTWIGLIAELVGNTFFLNEPLVYFRRHGENFSTHLNGDSFLNNKSAYSTLESVFLRYKLLVMIIFRIIKIKYVQK